MVLEATTGTHNTYKHTHKHTHAPLTPFRQNKGPGVVVGGRSLDVDLALSQDGARQLAATRVNIVCVCVCVCVFFFDS
jgi:hypothetical protein